MSETTSVPTGSKRQAEDEAGGIEKKPSILGLAVAESILHDADVALALGKCHADGRTQHCMSHVLRLLVRLGI
jgi:hypothetical protein